LANNRALKGRRKCPTNFSLSRANDKLKLVEHLTPRRTPTHRGSAMLLFEALNQGGAPGYLISRLQRCDSTRSARLIKECGKAAISTFPSPFMPSPTSHMRLNLQTVFKSILFFPGS
jgi:hypothetical protein